MSDPARLLFYWPSVGEGDPKQETKAPVQVKGVRRTGVAFTLDRVYRTLRSLAGLP
jgi:hypothetical protein